MYLNQKIQHIMYSLLRKYKFKDIKIIEYILIGSNVYFNAEVLNKNRIISCC